MFQEELHSKLLYLKLQILDSKIIKLIITENLFKICFRQRRFICESSDKEILNGRCRREKRISL